MKTWTHGCLYLCRYKCAHPSRSLALFNDLPSLLPRTAIVTRPVALQQRGSTVYVLLRVRLSISVGILIPDSPNQLIFLFIQSTVTADLQSIPASSIVSISLLFPAVFLWLLMQGRRALIKFPISHFIFRSV